LASWLHPNNETVSMYTALLGAALDHEALLTAVAEQQEMARQSYEREQALARTVYELGCPVIPLLPSVLLIPLIGTIDTARVHQVIEAVLQGISRYRATTILLDLTGVPLVDTQVANGLIQSSRAAALLGAQVVLVGLRPEIAQSIVSLGVDLSQLTTQPTLAIAIAALSRSRPLVAPAAPRISSR
jgi:anti-anti-sigma regulatory factor